MREDDDAQNDGCAAQVGQRARNDPAQAAGDTQKAQRSVHAKGAPKRGYTRQTKTTFEVLRLLYVSFALMRTQANKYFVPAVLSGAVPEDKR